MAKHLLAAALALATAAVAGGQVDVRDEPTQLVLRNERSTVVLSKTHKGAIVSLKDNATRQEFIAKQTEPCLFRLAFTKKGDVSGATQTFSSRDARNVSYSIKRSGERAAATLQFTGIAGREIDASCTASVQEGDPLVRWRISVSGSGPLVLEEVTFPIVTMPAKLGASVDDDASVAGFTKGGVFHRPGQWPLHTRVAGKQPGSLCAQFACYYDAMAGFHTAAHDAKGYPKKFEMTRVQAGVEFVWQHLCYHELGKPFQVDYDVVSTTFRGKDEGMPTDWRDAADLYKAWALGQPWCARTFAERGDVPAWMKSGPAMVRFGRDWLSRIPDIEEWLTSYWGKHFPANTELVVAYWGWERVGSWLSPKYFPVYPSDEAFAECVRITRKFRGHGFPWPSGYHWAVTYNKRPDGTFEWDDRADFEKTGRPHAVVKRDGSVARWEHPWLRGGANCALCRGDAWTRGWLNDIALELMKRGAELIQVDQVVGAAAPLSGHCYARGHGHPPGPGLWNTQAFAEQLRTMHEVCRKLNPDVILGFEEPQELYIQQVGIQDYRDFQVLGRRYWPARDPASVFGYLYHEFLPCFQSNPRGAGKMGFAYCLVNGQIPHLVPHRPVGPSPALVNGGFEDWGNGEPAGWQRVRSYLGVRWTGKPYRDAEEKHSGNFALRLENDTDRDTVQVSQNVPIGRGSLVVGQKYRLKLWVKSEALARPNRVGIAALDTSMGSRGGWAIDIPDGAACNHTWVERSVEITIPPGADFLRIMLHISGKAKVWLDQMSMEHIGKGGVASVAMRNGMSVEHDLVRQWVELFSGEARPYLLLGRMLHPPKLSTNSFTYTATFHRRASPRVVSVSTLTNKYKGLGSWSMPIAPTDREWTRKECTFTIPAGSEQCHVFLHFRGKGQFWFDDFVLTQAGSNANLVRNAAFEQWDDPSSAPEGWMHIKGYRGEKWTGKFHRDDKEQHGGKYCIRLENMADDEAVQVKQVLPVDGKTLSVGKTYRLGLWAKVLGVSAMTRISVEHKLPAILHNAYRAADGSEAVIAVNVTDEPQTGKLMWAGRAMELRLAPWEVRLIRN